MSKGTRRIRRRKGKRTRSCKCKLCGCKVCKCNKRNKRMRSLRRRGQKGGDFLNKISLGFLGKKDEKPALENVAGNVEASPNDTPPNTNSQSQTPSPYETPTQTQSPNPPDFCSRCREAHRSGECTLSIDDAGSGILKGAMDGATDMFNKTTETVKNATSDAQNAIANKVIDTGLAAKATKGEKMSDAMTGGKRRRRRRRTKKRKSKKKRGKKKSRKTRRRRRR